MGFSISWTDIPEPADNDEFLKRCRFHSVALDSDFRRFSDFSASSSDSDLCGFSDSDSWEDLLLKSQYSFVSGDNYPVLRLMENRFSGKVDFIYIDPPYNTGKKSFVYNDAFSSGGKNSERSEFSESEFSECSECSVESQNVFRNSVNSVDRHSAWLSFMSRRLKCAKNLLSESGCIFIAIGQEELYHLKLLCDQIFGEGNFINDFQWLCGKGKKDYFSRTMQQSNLCYAKNRKKLSPFADFKETSWADSNTDGDARGNWFSGSISFSEKRSNPNHPNYFEISSPSGAKWKRQWLLPKNEIERLLKEDKIYFGEPPEFSNVPRRKIFNGEKTEIIPKNIIDDVKSTRDAQNYLDSLLEEKNAFDNPKPVELIEHLISICNMKKDILVMDFFAGSGTTMEAVFNLNKSDGGNRRCILVQKPEKIDSKKRKSQSRFSDISALCLERIKKVVDGNILRLELEIVR